MTVSDFEDGDNVRLRVGVFAAGKVCWNDWHVQELAVRRFKRDGKFITLIRDPANKLFNVTSAQYRGNGVFASHQLRVQIEGMYDD